MTEHPPATPRALSGEILLRQLYQDVVFPLYGVADVDDGYEHRRKIEGNHVSAREFGIEARSVGYIADEPIQARHIVLDDFQQPISGGLGLGDWQCLDGAP